MSPPANSCHLRFVGGLTNSGLITGVRNPSAASICRLINNLVFVVAEGTTRQLRVLHIVGSGGIAEAMQPSLFMPLLTRLPKQRVKTQVVSLSPGCVRAAVLRQNGVPVHDVALSRRRFSAGGFKDLMTAVHAFRPDVIQAWGHTAQIASISVRKRCDWKPRVVWSVADTTPLQKHAGLIDRQKLKFAAKASARADRIVYASEAGAAHHRRVGFPEGGHECIPPGVDAARFKPDAAARRKVREQLQIPHEAFVIGMVAPFQPEYDHATLLKGVGELIKTNPNLYVLLAGHGVQRGNAPLMAMIGGGTLGTRTQLLGEWSDLASLFNACDLVCSSALTDTARMTLAMAMLCGVPCVATGMGAQGELLAQHGVAIEPGSPAAFIRGIGKILQMPQEKRIYMAQGARKHALQNFVYVRSLQKYLQLYADLIGQEALATGAMPAPEVDTLPPITAPAPPEPAARKSHAAVIADLSDPDSLEARVTPIQADALPKWRLEQEQERAKQDAKWSAPRPSTEGDVLQIFEMEIARPAVASVSAMNERARGVVDDFEELLSVEAITGPVPSAARPVVAAKSDPKDAVQLEAPPTAELVNSAHIPLQMTDLPVMQNRDSIEFDAAAAPTAISPAPESSQSQTASDTADASEPDTVEIEAPVFAEQAVESLPLAVTSPVIEPLTTADTTSAAPESLAATGPAATENGSENEKSEPKQTSLFDFDPLPEAPKQAISG
jgi:glycosyltransferase involved in cell wall biosynthesis